MLRALEGGRVEHGDTSEGTRLPAPSALPLVLSDATHAAIVRASVTHADTVARHDLRCANYTAYGKSAVKALRLSPDAWCQVRRQGGGNGPHYATVSLSHIHTRSLCAAVGTAASLL